MERGERAPLLPPTTPTVAGNDEVSALRTAAVIYARTVCQLVPEESIDEASACAALVACSKVPLRERAPALLRAAARCATRAREDIFRRALWKYRQHICMQAALQALRLTATTVRNLKDAPSTLPDAIPTTANAEIEHVTAEAQVSGLDDTIAEEMLAYANALLIPHADDGYSMLAFALRIGLHEVLDEPRVQHCLEAFWHGDIVPVWPLDDDRSTSAGQPRHPPFWLECGNDSAATPADANYWQCLRHWLLGLLRPERALAPIYFHLLSGLGYIGYCILYIYMVTVSDYRWIGWQIPELLLYSWSGLYVLEAVGKMSRQRLYYFYRIKHWCEVMAHGAVLASGWLRWRAMHGIGGTERAYHDAVWSALLVSVAAIPLAARTLAAFDGAAAGQGGLARLLSSFDRAAREMAWTLLAGGVLLLGISIGLVSLSVHYLSLSQAMNLIVRGLMFDAEAFERVSAVDGMAAPWMYRVVVAVCWLMLSNRIVAVHVAVYRSESQSMLRPLMARWAAGTERALCAPARHAFPTLWWPVVWLVIWPVELAGRLYRRISQRHQSTIGAGDMARAEEAPEEENEAQRGTLPPARRYTSSVWRLAIWWMTLGWQVLALDLATRFGEWLHRRVLSPGSPRW